MSCKGPPVNSLLDPPLDPPLEPLLNPPQDPPQDLPLNPPLNPLLDPPGCKQDAKLGISNKDLEVGTVYGLVVVSIENIGRGDEEWEGWCFEAERPAVRRVLRPFPCG